MRVSIVCGGEKGKNPIALATTEQLTEQLALIPDVIVSTEHPDIVHIIGPWTAQGGALARRLLQRTVPYVYTPLGSLAPWHNPSVAHQRLAAEAAAVVATGTMEQRLMDKHNGLGTLLIANAVTTATTTAATMAVAYHRLYEELIETSRQQMEESIDQKMQMLTADDPSLLTLCRQVLVVQQMYKKGSIPLSMLTALSSLLQDTDLDEEHAAALLSLVGLYPFSRRLAAVLLQTELLTEGFLPVPPLSDKESAALRAAITDYPS